MKEEIQKALEALKEGKTILYPTDTIWGLGCDATNEAAIKKIYQIKNRAESKSLIVLVNSEAMLNKYLSDIPSIAWDLIDTTEKPLTIVYPSARLLAKNAIASDGSIAIRLVKNEFCQQLIHRFNKPIISTSANFSGEKSPALYKDISEDLKKLVDYEVQLSSYYSLKGQPSSIIKLSMNGEIQLIRK